LSAHESDQNTRPSALLGLATCCCLLGVGDGKLQLSLFLMRRRRREKIAVASCSVSRFPGRQHHRTAGSSVAVRSGRQQLVERHGGTRRTDAGWTKPVGIGSVGGGAGGRPQLKCARSSACELPGRLCLLLKIRVSVVRFRPGHHPLQPKAQVQRRNSERAEVITSTACLGWSVAPS
jgi:hypothetical protein